MATVAESHLERVRLAFEAVKAFRRQEEDANNRLKQARIDLRQAEKTLEQIMEDGPNLFNTAKVGE